jgi:cytidylate kinase
MRMPRHVELLKRFLAQPQDVDVADCGYPFVTISRETGAGGHTLGREIIRHLDARPDRGWNRDWDLFDQKLCAYLAQDPATQASFDALMKEEYARGVQQSVFEMFTGQAETYRIQKRVAEVIRFLAYLGKVVIIGRAGMCIARDLPMGVHVRLVASEARRVEVMAEEMKADAAAALRAVRKQDGDRARLLRDVYRANIASPLLYDVVLNTERQSLAAMASAIEALLRARWAGRPRRQASPFGEEPDELRLDAR